MTSSDNYIFDATMDSDMSSEKFIDRKVVWLADSNGGVYSGNQIIFETSQTSNSGKWASFKESYFTIPIVIAAVGNPDISAAISPFSVAMKSGFYQLIDSFQVDYNGTSVTQLTPYLNLFTHFKVMSSWSVDSQQKYGATIGFWKDTATSLVYSAGASSNGNGIANNNALGAFTSLAATSYAGEAYNDGYLQRVRNTSYPLALPAIMVGGLQAYNIAPATTGISNFTNNGVAAAGRVYYWSIIAKIRPKDISDFFDKIPLTRSSFIRMTLNINTSTFKVTTVAAGTTMAIAAVTDLTVVGRTNPIMFASAGANQPNNLVAAAASVVTVAVGVGTVTLPGLAPVSNNIIQTCRMYVPLYTLVPAYEEQLLIMHPTRSIYYDDIYNFFVTGITTGSSFNALLTNGIVNPKRLVVIPTLNVASNATIPFTELASPFSSAPGTTAPLASIQRFQVTLSGMNIFNNNLDYDFDAFQQEVGKIGLNGGNSNLLTSGLINELDFTYAYRYYVANLERRLSMEDVYPKSVQISGVNTGAKTMDYICFITYGRVLKIKTSDGSVLTD